MPEALDTTCPFCGARFETGVSACPACDLPLLGADGSHPPERRRAPFDGAALFDDAFADTLDPHDSPHFFDPPLATERRRGEALRCVVVAMNAAEADMLGDMLRAEGVPCMVRTIGLHSYAQTSGRCEVLVPESALPAARELLRIEEPHVDPLDGPSPHLVAFAVVAGMVAIAAAIALIITVAY